MFKRFTTDQVNIIKTAARREIKLLNYESMKDDSLPLSPLPFFFPFHFKKKKRRKRKESVEIVKLSGLGCKNCTIRYPLITRNGWINGWMGVDGWTDGWMDGYDSVRFNFVYQTSLCKISFLWRQWIGCTIAKKWKEKNKTKTCLFF